MADLGELAASAGLAIACLIEPARYDPASYLNDPVLLERPSILALTKCDVLPGGTGGVDPKLLRLHERTVPISAVSGQGIEALVHAIARILQG